MRGRSLADFREPVAVIGLGRFGTSLALQLARDGTEVLAIDSSPQVVQRLSSSLSQVVAADATDEDALRQIGVADFRRAVVSIGAAQEASILCTALLADLGVKQIWAKALSEQHAKILKRVGAHHVVQPEADMGERVAHLVSSRVLDWIEVDPGWVLVRMRPPKEYVGLPLGQSQLRTKRHVTIVSVKPENSELFLHAGNDTVLRYGDQILVAGRPHHVERFVESL